MCQPPRQRGGGVYYNKVSSHFLVVLFAFDYAFSTAACVMVPPVTTPFSFFPLYKPYAGTKKESQKDPETNKPAVSSPKRTASSSSKVHSPGTYTCGRCCFARPEFGTEFVQVAGDVYTLAWHRGWGFLILYPRT